jgi:O-antigen ligase
MVYLNNQQLSGLYSFKPMSPSPADPAPRLGFPEKTGFCALAFFVFSIFSSAIDFIPFSRQIRPSLLAASVGLLMLGASGRFGVLIRNRVSITLIALTFWFILCVPFAVWPGGAAQTIAGQWLVTLLSLFLAGGLIWNSDQCRKIAHLIGYAAIILSVIALAMNRQSNEGRLALPGSRYENPNDLATILLTALPFLGFMALRKGNGIRRPLGVAGFVPILLVIANTGSRAAMIGAAAAALTVFFTVGFAQKMKLIIAGVIILVVILAALPTHLVKRFSTFFGDENDITQLAGAGRIDERTLSTIESSQNRRMLLMDSIALTLQHPVFGVGPGDFPEAQNDLAKARGEVMGNWHVTHNTYTQVSSESGFPGLALFLLAIIFCLSSISRTLRLPIPPGSVAWQDIHMMAATLRVSLVAFLSCAVFASLAYLPVITVLSGLAISLDFCVKNLLAPARPIVSPWRGQQALHSLPRRPLQPLSGRQMPKRA